MKHVLPEVGNAEYRFAITTTAGKLPAVEEVLSLRYSVAALHERIQHPCCATSGQEFLS
jgi:hypothetical protein